MPAPKTFAELMFCLEGITWSSGHPGCWRGQADIAWPMDCTAARRLKLSQQDLNGGQDNGSSLESWVRRYEDRLLQQARMAGHGFLDSRRLSDLELLSVLRHYGAATRLMDFTRNAFVALWFACRSHPQKYGLLACLDSNAVRTIKREETLEATVPLLLDKPPAHERFFLWEPRQLFERMRVQQSIFVFGKVEDKRWGTAPFRLRSPTEVEGNGDLLLFAISPQLRGSANRVHISV
jgi:FRG domain